MTPEDEKYVPDIVQALEQSGAPVPAEIAELCKGMCGHVCMYVHISFCTAAVEKRDKGEMKFGGSGYGGKGYQFNEAEEEEKNAQRKQEKLV